MSSIYHNLKLDEKSSYLTTLECQFGRNRYKRLLFGATPAVDMFQRKINRIVKGFPNVFGIANDILVVRYEVDGKDYDQTLWKVLKMCRQLSLKLNKIMPFQMCISLVFGEIISRHGVDLWKLIVLTEMSPPKMKKELQAFLRIINYLSKGIT